MVSLKFPHISTPLTFIQYSQFILLGFLALAAVSGSALVYVLTIGKDTTLPNQYIYGQNVSGLTKNQLIAELIKIENELKASPKKILVGSKEYEFTPQQLGMQIEKEVLAEQLITKGKKGSLQEKFNALSAHFFQENEAELLVDFEDQKTQVFFEKISTENDIAEQAPRVRVEDERVTIDEGKQGKRLDKFTLIHQIANSIQVQSDRPIQAKVTTTGAKWNEKEKTELLNSVNSVLEAPLIISYDNTSKELRREDKLKLIALVEPTVTQDITLHLREKTIAIGLTNQPNNPDKQQIVLNKPELKALVEDLKKEVNQEAINARFAFDGQRASAFTASQEGKQLDEAFAIQEIGEALLTHKPNLTLRIETTKPAITNETVNNLGIKELLGQGVSKFSGSGEGRVFNLSLGTQRLNGVLVPPGETFSMYEAVGDVESSTGYKEAYVILNGRTQVGVGGGICQVSTTLFRAALNAGLPIVERHQHAYRVGYYELASSPGIDAAVYFPGSDFKFKNDTPGYILIQTSVDTKNAVLTYNIYGTGDGRRVEVSQPVVKNVRPAPAPMYQDDPTLPKGATKQVDFAASGADTVFTRTIYDKNGSVVAQSNFVSNYRPWQAIFLRGTREG